MREFEYTPVFKYALFYQIRKEQYKPVDTIKKQKLLEKSKEEHPMQI